MNQDRMHSSRRGSPRGRGGFRSNSAAPPPFSFRRRNPPPPPPPKPLPPPPPRSRDDVLREAGRLATDYLISQGLLPPNLLTSRSSNLSALSRLGNGSQQYDLHVSPGSADYQPQMKTTDIAGCSQAYQLPNDNDGPQASNASAETELKVTRIETDVVKDDHDLEKKDPLDENMDDADILTKNGDLLRLCNNFAKVPTKTRSSLTPKTDEKHNSLEPHNKSPQFPSKTFMDLTFITESQNSISLDSDDVCKAPSVENVGLLTTALAVEKGESQSSLDIPILYEQGQGQGLSHLGTCHSMLKDRGDKRALQDNDMGEGFKKAKECPSTPVAFTDDYFHHNFNANTSHSHNITASDAQVVQIIDQERMFDISLLPSGALDSGIESKEEKQLFPCSFKICDLNLIESSDMAETHDSNPVYGIPSTAEAQKGVQVDVDLSISNSCNRSDDYDRSAGASKESVIVEIDDDSAKEDDDFDTSERKTENAHSNLEHFSNSTDNNGDLPDAQDGYGLMISELLGNGISNCSSVPADITGLDTDTGLQNGVEILDDDDPIYLSLGEIPISFLGVWEQPTQPFEKPF